MTFSMLCSLEPRLRDLERAVTARGSEDGRRPGWCANAAWYGFGRYHGEGFKARLAALVGYHRVGPPHGRPADPRAEAVLRSSSAYDAATEHLYALLPGCRRCGCL